MINVNRNELPNVTNIVNKMSLEYILNEIPPTNVEEGNIGFSGMRPRRRCSLYLSYFLNQWVELVIRLLKEGWVFCILPNCYLFSLIEYPMHSFIELCVTFCRKALVTELHVQVIKCKWRRITCFKNVLLKYFYLLKSIIHVQRKYND